MIICVALDYSKLPDDAEQLKKRAIRALVLGRRNYLFAGSDAGGEVAGRLYSLIGTCRLDDIDPHLYLADLLPWQVAPHLMLPLARVA
jgi:hypothetical protein